MRSTGTRRGLAIASLALVLSAQAGFAASGVASLQHVSGKVLVNLGDGFVAAQDGQLLAPGARILVGKDSTAVVAYEKCNVTLGQPTVHVVRKEPSCDVIMPVADVPDPVVSPLPWLLVGGGIVVGGAIVLLSDDDDDSVSP